MNTLSLKGTTVQGQNLAFESHGFDAYEQALALSGKKLEITAGTARVLPCEEPADKTFKIPVDYGLSLDALKRRGRYDWSNSLVCEENFPIKREAGKMIGLRLVVPRPKERRHTVSPEQSIEDLAAQSLRPATIQELLSVGSILPMLQLRYQIVALGSIIGQGGNRQFPALSSSGLKRGLDLLWYIGPLDPRQRMLAVAL